MREAMSQWPKSTRSIASAATRSLTCHRAQFAPRRRECLASRSFTTAAPRLHREGDPRIRALGRDISDDFATIRENYEAPRHPIVLAHGLFGFAELRLNEYLPAVQYWHGIKEALTAQGATVITPSVPPSSSIADRAAALRAALDAAADASSTSSLSSSLSSSPSPAVNIIAHSMGGLDARYMLAHLPGRTRVASLVTVASPHRGSAFADYMLDETRALPIHLPRLYGTLERAGLGTAAFAQLTRGYMADEFNPATPDDPAVRYFSYGAAVRRPPLLSPFRLPHAVVTEAEGRNDGLVSVESSRWGTYKGTLLGVSHLDLINWSNRLGWTVRGWMGVKKKFNAIAFYLDIADMLAREGL